MIIGIRQIGVDNAKVAWHDRCNRRSSVKRDMRESLVTSSRCRGSREPIYDGPIVKLVKTEVPALAPAQPIIIDKYGEVKLDPSDFLRMKRKASRTNSAVAIYQTARQLVDMLFVMENFNGGRGLPLESVSDTFLEQLRIHFTGPKFSKGRATGCRGISNRTWNSNLSVFLQYLLYCERKGRVNGLIGIRSREVSFKVELEEANPFPVHRLVLPEVEPDEVVIPDDAAFEAVQAAREEMVVNPVLNRRNALISAVMDEGLRRSEAVSLPIDVIPAASAVRRLRSAAQSSGIPKPVPIRVVGAKTGRVRVVNFALALVERIRDFIDDDRPTLRPARGERAIFVSQKSGKQLNPQIVTNQYCSARTSAITTAREEGADELEIKDIRRVRPHVHRHRHVTDGLTTLLENGIDPVHAMLDVMSNAGMSLSTMIHYLHLGQSRRKSVLKKQGRVDEIKEDVVIERLRAFDLAKLKMMARKSQRRR